VPSAPQPSPDLISKPLTLYLPPAGSDPVLIVCVRENHDLPVTFTKHPVEQGAPVSDHARPEQWKVTLDCLASRTPIDQGYADADQLWAKLKALQGTPALVDVLTIGHFYKNMGVTNVGRGVDVKTANGLQFTLTLEQVRIVRNKTTRTVRTKDPKGQSAKKKGAVDAKPVDNRTTAAKLLDAIKGKG